MIAQLSRRSFSAPAVNTEQPSYARYCGRLGTPNDLKKSGDLMRLDDLAIPATSVCQAALDVATAYCSPALLNRYERT